ncbi:hypothetical protein ACHAQA_002230 [Verticillium albo-atrum]
MPLKPSWQTKIEIGTPGQRITVLLDTGSSELWVNPDCDTVTSPTGQSQCLTFGQYHPANSTTPAVGPFGSRTISYGDPSDPGTQTSAAVEYYADAIAILGGKHGGDPIGRITNQTFGVVVESHGTSQGILGLAPDLKTGFDGDQPYSLLLNSLAEQGVIAKRLFSLDLRHADAAEGAVIYGGLDRGKFSGNLAAVPLTKGTDGLFRLSVDLASISMSLPDRNHTYPFPAASRNVMLDSGTTLSRLHAKLADPILRDLGARDSPEDNHYLAPCALRASNSTITFAFGDDSRAQVRVPLSDFILDLRPSTSDMDDWCYVGLMPTKHQQVLGDSFLRAGYFVFDWDERVVHVAQAANCGDKIIAIEGDEDLTKLAGLCEAEWAKGEDADGKQSSPNPLASMKGKQAYTTAYTVTSCPTATPDCETGRVVTKTVEASLAAGTTSAASLPSSKSSAGEAEEADPASTVGSDADSAARQVCTAAGASMYLAYLSASIAASVAYLTL